MTTRRAGVHVRRLATPRARASRGARFGSSVKARLGGLAVLAAMVGSAAPAQALTAPAATPVSTAEREALVLFADDHTSSLVDAATRRRQLPFAEPDWVMLVLGAVIVTVAAAGAPLLLRPLRGIPPVLAAAAAPDQLLPVSVHGAAAACPRLTGPT